jgi:hypothetical protein
MSRDVEAPRNSARPPWWVITTSPLTALLLSALWAVVIIMTLATGGPTFVWEIVVLACAALLILGYAVSLFWMVRTGRLPQR